MRKWFQEHEWARRALRTFFQAAIGVLTANLAESAGMLENMNMEAVIVLAVSTGLAAVMNLTKGETAYDGTDTGGV